VLRKTETIKAHKHTTFQRQRTKPHAVCEPGSMTWEWGCACDLFTESEWSGLEGTSVGHPVQTPCRSRVTHSRLHRAASRWVLNISKEGDSRNGSQSVRPEVAPGPSQGRGEQPLGTAWGSRMRLRGAQESVRGTRAGRGAARQQTSLRNFYFSAAADEERPERPQSEATADERSTSSRGLNMTSAPGLRGTLAGGQRG